jgi:hypothetical protein
VTKELLAWASIIALSIAAAIGYGVIHDQITAHVCVEYFTIGHPPVFATDNPILLGLGWGVIATWWVGALLGLALAAAARVGRRTKQGAGSLVRPIAWLTVVTGLFACAAGLTGWWLASRGTVQLADWLAERVPVEKRAAFLADGFAHTASYATGFLGAMVVLIYVWRKRGHRGPVISVIPPVSGGGRGGGARRQR